MALDIQWILITYLLKYTHTSCGPTLYVGPKSKPQYEMYGLKLFLFAPPTKVMGCMKASAEGMSGSPPT